MFDDLEKSKEDNLTIGIILCTDEDKTVIKYLNIKDKNLFVSKYKLYLPSEEELQKELSNFNLKEKTMKTAFYKTKLCTFKICYTDKAITYLKFAKDDEDISKSETSKLSDKAYMQLNEYLEGKRKEFDLPLHAKGTPFQKQVWDALTKIPYGETRSYKDIAEFIGNPKAVRAVGMANNKNPITIIVPCHRVIGSNGELVGYAGGVDKKRWLLEMEQGLK